MKVADVMSRQIVTVSPGHSVRHAARLMLEHRVSGLPVVDDEGALVGIVTEGDLMRRAELGVPLAPHPAWQQRTAPDGAARDLVRTRSWKVGDVMSSPAATIPEDMPVERAAAMLDARGIKRLPVVRDGSIVGILSRADLLRVIADYPQEDALVGDEAILLCVRARLREALDILRHMPDIRVIDGVVHVKGRVESEAERAAVRVVVEGVAGIAGFEDHLQVAPRAR